MSDDKAQQEPSMEDILASIRRILSEDEAEEKAKAPPPPPPPPPPPKFEPEPEPEPRRSPQDDIDALFASMNSPAPEPEEDVLELTEDMVLDEPEPEPEPVFEPDPEPEPVMAAMASQLMDDPDPEPLMSRPAVDRGSSALSELARAVAQQRGIGLGNGGVTLEDMVREILKLMIKDWLDENLPYMIERIVKKEIERMVNRAENL